MDREQIIKIISSINHNLIKGLEGFTVEKAIELADSISKNINGELKSISHSYLTPTSEQDKLLISRESIRDILMNIGVGGHIAYFSIQLADEINKYAPLKNEIKALNKIIDELKDKLIAQVDYTKFLCDDKQKQIKSLQDEKIELADALNIATNYDIDSDTIKKFNDLIEKVK